MKAKFLNKDKLLLVLVLFIFTASGPGVGQTPLAMYELICSTTVHQLGPSFSQKIHHRISPIQIC